jgi:hypothetical protein
MRTKIPQEFEGLCVGLDVLLTYEKRKPSTQEEADRQFDSIVQNALSTYDKGSLQRLMEHLSSLLASDDAERVLEEIWMSFRPTRVFFSSRQSKNSVSPYVLVFERVLAVAREQWKTLGR